MFNSKFYPQIKYCAMGTIWAPVDASVFMAEFEQKSIYPLIKDKSVLFLHYIDNILIKWSKSESKTSLFIKFGYKFDCTWIDSLYTLVYLDEK